MHVPLLNHSTELLFEVKEQGFSIHDIALIDQPDKQKMDREKYIAKKVSLLLNLSFNISCSKVSINSHDCNT